MGNQLKQRSYKCNCGTITKEHVWDNDLDKTKIKCSNCSIKLTKSDLILANKVEVASIRTPTKNR